MKGVFSTSDSWPHVGGVRQAVGLGLPVYILDLNQALLDRMIQAPHSIHPDLLAQSKKQPVWRVVSGRVALGSGPNRVELYPIRGASTERQYMVYFPEHHILYASDTLALNNDGSLYDPQLMREVAAAVKREGLEVTTVFAMHQGPTPVSGARVDRESTRVERCTQAMIILPFLPRHHTTLSRQCNANSGKTRQIANKR